MIDSSSKPEADGGLS